MSGLVPLIGKNFAHLTVNLTSSLNTLMAVQVNNWEPKDITLFGIEEVGGVVLKPLSP